MIDTPPPHLQPYQVTPKKETVIEEQIEGLLKKNFIKVSKYPYSTSVYWPIK